MGEQKEMPSFQAFKKMAAMPLTDNQHGHLMMRLRN